MDINEIQARKLRAKKLSDWPTGVGGTASAASANLRAQLGGIVNEAIAEASRQHALYDSETNHGRIGEAQRRWVARIRRELGGG